MSILVLYMALRAAQELKVCGLPTLQPTLCYYYLALTGTQYVAISQVAIRWTASET